MSVFNFLLFYLEPLPEFYPLNNSCGLPENQLTTNLPDIKNWI